VAVGIGRNEQNLFSQSWYRVGGLRPRLRSHVQIHRQIFRGVEWFVLQDHSTGRFHRISPEAYFIVGLMDGKRTMNDIWDAAGEHLRDRLPTQDEVINILSQLHQFDAIQSDLPPDMEEMNRRSRRVRQVRILNWLASPLSIKFPLVDPDAFLTDTMPLIRPLFSYAGFAAWLATVVYGLVLAGIHWGELTANVADQVLSLENLLILSLVYPAVKVLHEFGHAYAVKRWGGEVHEMGVMLLVFMPVPYVDATASYAFRNKRQRMLVGGAGIMVELLLAAVAMIVWIDVQPGAVRAIAYNLMIIGGVSTVLMNGNPLIKYDAYYVLSDFIEIPNLAARSSQYLAYFAKCRLLGIPELTSTARSTGEAVWLATYGIASFAYRLFVTVAIALFIAGKFFIVGMILAIWSLLSFIVNPVVVMLRHVAADPLLQRYRQRLIFALTAASVTIVVIVTLVRVPTITIVEGVIRAPDEAQLNATADGFVLRVSAAPGAKVRKGDVLLVSEAPRLDKDVQVSEASLREVSARYMLSRVMDRAATGVLREEMMKIQAELQRTRERQAGLVLSSPADGIFILPNAEDLPGRYVKKGMALGYVVDFSRAVVRIVVDQDNVDLVRSRTVKVEARLAGNLSEIIPAHVVREVPEASSELPSLALSTGGGGGVALDPESNGKKAPKAYRKNFIFDIALDNHTPTRIGERVFIRFIHSSETLVEKWYRVIRRLLLKRFDV